MKPTLTAERLKELVHYDPDTGVFTRRTYIYGRWQPGMVVGGPDGRGYRCTKLDGQRYVLHRLAWLYVTGDWPRHFIDHINGVKTDNRFCNLRDVPQSVNMQNTRAPISGKTYSKLMGAQWNKQKGRWQAKLVVDGRQVLVGYFATDAEASLAYVAAKRRLHPGFML